LYNVDQWKDASGSNVATLSPSHTDVDYAWLCDGGTYVKAYNAYPTVAAPTDPTVLEQCGTTPTSIGDLKGWPASDSFSGAGCDSGSVGDANWDMRWTAGTHDGTSTITSNDLVFGISGGSGVRKQIELNTGVASGAFTAEVVVDWSAMDVSLANGESAFFLLIGPGSASVVVGKWDPAGSYLPNQTGYDFQKGFASLGDAAAAGTDTLRLVRDASDNLTGYFNAVSYDFGVVAGDCSPQLWLLSANYLFLVSAAVESFTFVDGSSNPILIDPTGTACS